MQKLDPSVRPQDDFFGYVNNNWLKDNPMPPSESMWGTFYILRDNARKAINNIVKELSATDSDKLSHDQKLLKTYFSAAFSLSDHRDSHLRTLGEELDKIHAIANMDDLARYLGYAHRHDFSVFWEDYVEIDDKNSSIQVLRVHQSGLVLPNRDYYLDDTEKMAGIRAAYQQHHERVASLLPELTPKNWDAIIGLEVALAKVSWTDVELRDVHKNYTRFTLAELKTRFPAFDWTGYFEALGLNGSADDLVVDQPSFIEAAINLINTLPIEDVKAYMSWQIINRLLSWIDETAAEISFEFFGKTLTGAKEIKPLWERAIMQADVLIIGEALGREYAARHFPETSKLAISDMVEDIRRSYHRRIDTLEWMLDGSKQVAHRKLDNIKVFVGYPSKWRDLSRLEFSADNHLANLLTARNLSSDIDLEKVGQTPADEDWFMNAHTVNAYNHPNRLEIVFPAAILQAPFYDPEASYASNLGGIGAVIGHEFTHGFDDQGSEFDEFGNVNPWQSADEQAAFKKLAANIVKQADSFETTPGTFLQGELILGEAIADVGGLELAVEALREKTEAGKLEDALRQLFVNAATAECGMATAERLVELAKVDPHPPSPFRVNCVFGHVDAFYEAFDVTAQDKLYLAPEDRAHIW